MLRRKYIIEKYITFLLPIKEDDDNSKKIT